MKYKKELIDFLELGSLIDEMHRVFGNRVPEIPACIVLLQKPGNRSIHSILGHGKCILCFCSSGVFSNDHGSGYTNTRKFFFCIVSTKIIAHSKMRTWKGSFLILWQGWVSYRSWCSLLKVINYRVTLHQRRCKNKRTKGKSHISVTQRGKKFMKKCSVLLNNYSIKRNCVKNVI